MTGPGDVTDPTDPTEEVEEVEGEDDEKTPEERAEKKRLQMEKRDQKKAGPHGKSGDAPGRNKERGVE